MAHILRGLAVAGLLATVTTLSASATESPPRRPIACPAPPSTGELGFRQHGRSALRCTGVRGVPPRDAVNISARDIGLFLVNHVGLSGQKPSFVAVLAVAVISDARAPAFLSLRRNKDWRDHRARRQLDPSGLDINRPLSPEAFIGYHLRDDEAGLDRFLGERLHGIPRGSDQNSWDTRDGWIQNPSTLPDCNGGRCSVTLRLLRFEPATADQSANPVDFSINTVGFRKLYIWTYSPDYDELIKRYEITLID